MRVNASLAADAVGASRMDRPEWCAVHPQTGEIYYTLTNNSNRRLEHPGETFSAANVANPAACLSHGPGNAGYGTRGASARPRSATLVVSKHGGGLIGS